MSFGEICAHPLEKEMATHSSVLAWRIPGTGEPGGLPSRGHTESDTTEATQQQQQQQQQQQALWHNEITWRTLKILMSND